MQVFPRKTKKRHPTGVMQLGEFRGLEGGAGALVYSRINS